MQYQCRFCSSQGPLCHTTAASVRRKVRYAIPLPLVFVARSVMQYQCRFCSSQGPLCHTTASSVRRKIIYAIPHFAEPKPHPLNLPTQNGSGFTLPNQNGIETEVPHLAEPKPHPLNQPTQNGSGSKLPNQNGIETEAASHLPTQNGGSGFTLADPKRLCLHICRTKTAVTSEGPTLFFTIPLFSRGM